MKQSDRRVQQLSERVWIYHHNWERLEPAVGMVFTDEGWIAIEGGNAPRHGQCVYDAMQALHTAPVSYVIDTHRHFDHVFGNQAFDAPVIASQRCRERFEQNVADDWAPDRALDWLKGTIFGYNDQLSEADFEGLALVPPVEDFQGEMDLEVGGVTFELFDLAGVHTDDGIGIHVPEEGVLFLGDAFYFQGTPEGRALQLGPLLDRVATRNARVYVAGHERVFDEFVFKRLFDYGQTLLDGLSRQAAQGASVETALAAQPLDPEVEKTTFISKSFHRRLVKAAMAELG